MSLSTLFLAVSIPLSGGDGFFVFTIYGLYFVLLAILHLAFSSAVFSDARHLRANFGRGTFLVGPGMWWLATLLGGLVAVAIYWAIHHSRLRPARPPAPLSMPVYKEP
jgi:hypothetical protein